MIYANVKPENLIKFRFGKQPIKGQYLNFDWKLIGLYDFEKFSIQVFVFKVKHKGNEWERSLTDPAFISIDHAAQIVCSKLEHELYPV